MNLSYFGDLPHKVIESVRATDYTSVGWEFLILLIGILIIAFLINIFLSYSVLGQSYRIFVAPGVIIHEFGHILFCLLTGAKITKVSLFDKEGGSVEHAEPKVPIIGQLLISLAPLLFGIISIYFLIQWIGIHPVVIESKNFSIHEAAQFFISFSKNALKAVDFRNYINWIILYLIISITVTMTPSKQDMKNIALTLIFLLALGFLLFGYLHLHFSWSFLSINKIVALLSTVFVLLIFMLIFSIIIFGASKLRRT